MENLDLSQVTVLAGIFIANIASILGTYVSMRERLVRLEVKVDRLENDVNNLGNLYRKSKACDGETSE